MNPENHIRTGLKPGHPWYYIKGNPPLPVEAITPSDASLYDNLPQDRHKLEAMLSAASADLTPAIARYQELLEKGGNALSDYELKSMTHPLSSALAYKHNHIAHQKGLIVALEDALGQTLF